MRCCIITIITFISAQIGSNFTPQIHYILCADKQTSLDLCETSLCPPTATSVDWYCAELIMVKKWSLLKILLSIGPNLALQKKRLQISSYYTSMKYHLLVCKLNIPSLFNHCMYAWFSGASISFSQFILIYILTNCRF